MTKSADCVPYNAEMKWPFQRKEKKEEYLPKVHVSSDGSFHIKPDDLIKSKYFKDLNEKARNFDIKAFNSHSKKRAK